MLKKVPEIPKFEGRFFRWSAISTTNREKGISESYLVFSSGRRGAVLKFLWLKLLWDNLTSLEYSLFLSLPEILNDNKKFSFLKASINLPKSILRQNLIKFENFLGDKESSREKYQGIKGMRLEIHRIERGLPKIKPYSGYVKSPSSVGSKSSKSLFLETPASTEYIIEENNYDWYYLLTVGELTLLNGVYIFPDEWTQEGPKRLKELNFKLMKNES